MAIQIADSKQPFLLSQFLPQQTDSQPGRVTVEELKILFENYQYPTFQKTLVLVSIICQSPTFKSIFKLVGLSSISILKNDF